MAADSSEEVIPQGSGSSRTQPEPPVPEITPASQLGITALSNSARNRALWREIAVVLAVGVIPNLVAAIAVLYHPVAPSPYWLDALQLAVLSGCTIVVVVYLIGQSGEGRERFGLGSPEAWDLVFWVFLLMAAEAIGRFVVAIPWPDWSWHQQLFPRPREMAQYPMMVTKYAFATFSEELVRVYLIVRLSQLLSSRVEGLIIATILFASYHLYAGLPGVVNAFLFGLAFGIAFLCIGRIWSLAFAHALYDMRLELMVV